MIQKYLNLLIFYLQVVYSNPGSFFRSFKDGFAFNQIYRFGQFGAKAFTLSYSFGIVQIAWADTVAFVPFGGWKGGPTFRAR